MEVALECCQQVIAEGRISKDGTQYCYATSFKTSEGNVIVVSDLNKASDRLTVIDEDRGYA